MVSGTDLRCIFRYGRVCRGRGTAVPVTPRAYLQHPGGAPSWSGAEVQAHALRHRDSPFLMCSASSSCCFSLTGSSMFLFSGSLARCLLIGWWSEVLGDIREEQDRRPDRSSSLVRDSTPLPGIGFTASTRPRRRWRQSPRAAMSQPNFIHGTVPRHQGRRFRPLSGSHRPPPAQ